MKHSLKNVIVDNDVQEAEGVEIAIKHQRQDGSQHKEYHVHRAEAIDVDGRVGLLWLLQPKPAIREQNITSAQYTRKPTF